MTAIQRWLVALASTVAAVVVCYYWVDRPLALLVNTLRPHRAIFAHLTYLPDPLILFAAFVFVALGLWVLAARPTGRLTEAGVLCSISLIVGETIKAGLKFAFGRTWPDTWVANNPSFIQDGVYGFNPFHGGPGYASFPSGHTAAICATVAVLWLVYPKLRVLYALAVLSVVVGLIGANFHFLGDVIAGGFVGISTGWMTVALWRAHAALRGGER